jgi:hypothetical protein
VGFGVFHDLDMGTDTTVPLFPVIAVGTEYLITGWKPLLDYTSVNFTSLGFSSFHVAIVVHMV